MCKGKSKGKDHPSTGREGPAEELRYICTLSTLSLTPVIIWIVWSLYPRKGDAKIIIQWVGVAHGRYETCGTSVVSYGRSIASSEASSPQSEI
jgi:hypothetical protein